MPITKLQTVEMGIDKRNRSLTVGYHALLIINDNGQPYKDEINYSERTTIISLFHC